MKQFVSKVNGVLVLIAIFSASVLLGEDRIPEWCRALPRPAYKSLQRVPVRDSWFEVYNVAPGTYAIYEPHQSEETISYLIVGDQKALLFDTGMGIGNLRQTTAELTNLPIVVLSSHTHNDHVGDNWQFATIYGMDTDSTRANARGSRQDAQVEIAPDEICGKLPIGFDPKTYETRPWKFTSYIHDGDRIDLGRRSIEVLGTPGHTPDAICPVTCPVWFHSLERDGLRRSLQSVHSQGLWPWRLSFSPAAGGSVFRMPLYLRPCTAGPSAAAGKSAWPTSWR